MNKDKVIKLNNRINEDLRGKVVDKVAFYSTAEDEEMNHLIIKFTDETFIAIGIDTDYYDDGRYSLCNANFRECEDYRKYDRPFRLNTDRSNFVMDEYLKQRVDMGVINDITLERVRELYDEEIKENERREYLKYLELKEKFEN